MDKKKKLNIKLTPDKIEAKYTDFAMIAKNMLGFNLDFMQRVPGRAEQLNVVSRIAMSPQHAKLLLHLLKKNVKEYEKEFGKIKLPEKKMKENKKGLIHFK